MLTRNRLVRRSLAKHTFDRALADLVLILANLFVDRIGSELEGGKAAVGVLAPVSESSPVASKLTDLGGITEAHDIPDEVLDEAHTEATS